MPAVIVAVCEVAQLLIIPLWNKSHVIFTQALTVSCSTERGEGSVCQQHLNTKTSGGWQRNKDRLLQVLFSCFQKNPLLGSIDPHCTRIKGIQLQTEIVLLGQNWDFTDFTDSFPLSRCVTKIPVFVYFRYSHGTGSATPLIQAKMDDPSWWRWRVGWAMAWSWCWTSSRMNTCPYGERLVSLPGGKTSANTHTIVCLSLPFFLIN